MYFSVSFSCCAGYSSTSCPSTCKPRTHTHTHTYTHAHTHTHTHTSTHTHHRTCPTPQPHTHTPTHTHPNSLQPIAKSPVLLSLFPSVYSSISLSLPVSRSLRHICLSHPLPLSVSLP